jgi:hypothetical protein
LPVIFARSHGARRTRQANAFSGVAIKNCRVYARLLSVMDSLSEATAIAVTG